MAQSYVNFKENLNEQEKKLLEIGQRVVPYEKDFLFYNKGIDIETEFTDDQRNRVKVIFHRFKEGLNSFEVEFTVNGNSGEAFKTDTKHFFRIISTVVQAINEFIEKYAPSQLHIEGYDKPGKEGQKDRIWLQYAKVNINADNYTLGRHPKGFGLQKQLNKN
jgi:hypothetical protein